MKALIDSAATRSIISCTLPAGAAGHVAADPLDERWGLPPDSDP